MKLIIKQNENIIRVSFANEFLEISENSNQWTTEGINKFLIQLASKTPDGEEIELEFDETKQDQIFLHVVDLFSEFAKEYNHKTKIDNQS